MVHPPLALSPDAQQRYAAALLEAPLGIYRAESADYRAIPASLQPLLIADQTYQQVSEDCALILDALQKLAIFLRQAPQSAGTASPSLFAHLRGLEAEAAAGFDAHPLPLATVRFDLFFAEQEIRLLEINTTIPAMQAYADMVRDGFAAAWDFMAGEGEGETAPKGKTRQLLAKRSSSHALLDALLARAKGPIEHIAIVSRPDDSQQAELLYLQKLWQTRGYQVSYLHPEALRLKNDKLFHGKQPIDLVYRHIFASGIPPASDFAKACRQGSSSLSPVFNPVAAHLEAKALLAELSRRAASRDERPPKWTEAECAAIGRRLPWTRLLRPGAGTIPSGETVPDLLAFIEQSGCDNWVFKTNGGYGGHGVIIGTDFLNAATQSRLAQLLSCPAPLSFKNFLQRISAGADLWIVQERIKGRIWNHSYLAWGETNKAPEMRRGERDYIDLSVFGPGPEGAGAVSRFAADPIVNLGRGGGLVPVLLASEAAAIGLATS